MASNLDYAEDIEEAKAYMAKKNVFQLFEVSNFHSHGLTFNDFIFDRSALAPNVERQSQLQYLIEAGEIVVIWYFRLFWCKKRPIFIDIERKVCLSVFVCSCAVPIKFCLAGISSRDVEL